MLFWNHTEFVYPFVPQEIIDAAPSVRASLPNRHCDPQAAKVIYDEIFEEYRLCDELGINICTNEHHGGINNLSGANPVITGAVARTTRRAKILSMGTLVTVRDDPVRIAEEYATIDVLSGGRLVVGFVKSGATEMASGDRQPLFRNERQWEAVDLIDKALSHRDGPFSWEGEHFTHAHVNIWPQPIQDPRPDFWMATSEPGNVVQLAERKMGMVSVFTGTKRARAATELYTRTWRDTHGTEPPEDRFGYCAFLVVADTDAEAHRIVEKLNWFHTVGNKVAPQYNTFLPGFLGDDRLLAAWRPNRRKMDLSPETLIGAGLIFAGNPDSVTRQIATFRDEVGSLGNLVMQTKSGFVTHKEAMHSYTLAATEVLPRLQAAGTRVRDAQPEEVGI